MADPRARSSMQGRCQLGRSLIAWVHHSARAASTKPNARVASEWAAKGRIARRYHCGPCDQRSTCRRGMTAVTTPSPTAIRARDQGMRRMLPTYPAGTWFISVAGFDLAFQESESASSSGSDSRSTRRRATARRAAKMPPRIRSMSPWPDAPDCRPRLRTEVAQDPAVGGLRLGSSCSFGDSSAKTRRRCAP